MILPIEKPVSATSFLASKISSVCERGLIINENLEEYDGTSAVVKSLHAPRGWVKDAELFEATAKPPNLRLTLFLLQNTIPSKKEIPISTIHHLVWCFRVLP